MESEVDAPTHLRVYLVVIATSTIHLATGAVLDWSSPVLPKLNLTTSETSWVGSLYSLGAAPGPLVITLCLDTIGRKGTLFVIWMCFLVSWAVLLMSQDIWFMYVARFIGGIGVGGASAAVPIYIAEVAITEIRGRLGALSFFSVRFGALFIYIIGPYVDYYALAGYGLGVSMVFGVLFYFIPESPYYYIKKGRKNEAASALQRLRGYRTRQKLEEELQEMEKTVFRLKDTTVNFWSGIREQAAKRALFIGIFLVIMQQTTGGSPISAYSQSIFERAKLDFPASTVPIVNTLLSVFFSFIPVLIVNKLLSIKSCLIVSGFGCAFSSVVLGIYFYVINDSVDVGSYSVVSVIALMVGTCFSGVGLGPLVWPLVGELLPLPVKGVATGICGIMSSLVGFSYLKLFPEIADPYGYSTSFFILAGGMFGMTVASIFLIPQTSGKTLQEIQELLARK